MALVGYNDLQGRSAYQPIVINQGGREVAYVGHHAGLLLNPLTGQSEANGTSIVDVTDPARPQYLAHIRGPAGSIDAAGSQMVRVCSGSVLPGPASNRGKWYLLRTHGNSSPAREESQEIYDVTNPRQPKLLKVIVDQLSNTHKNWWECDSGIAYLVANDPVEGWQHSGSKQHLKIYDLSNPESPVYIRDFGLVGQQPSPANATPPPGIHGPISAGSGKNRVYMAYGVGSNGVFQIVDRNKLLHDFSSKVAPSAADLAKPQLGILGMSPDQGGHTAFPIFGMPIPGFRDGFSQLKRRDIVVLVSEAGANQCQEGPHLAFLVDVSNEATPFPISTLRVPEFPGDFCNKGGRFGAHAVTESFYPAYYGKLSIISWFNAGVRVWDIRDPFAPQEVAYFISAPNGNTIANCATIGGVTTCRNAIQTNNVELDDRGLVYIVDRAGTGMHILRFTGRALEVVEANPNQPNGNN
jgi:hypothetical protein